MKNKARVLMFIIFAVMSVQTSIAMLDGSTRAGLASRSRADGYLRPPIDRSDPARDPGRPVAPTSVLADRPTEPIDPKKPKAPAPTPTPTRTTAREHKTPAPTPVTTPAIVFDLSIINKRLAEISHGHLKLELTSTSQPYGLGRRIMIVHTKKDTSTTLGYVSFTLVQATKSVPAHVEINGIRIDETLANKGFEELLILAALRHSLEENNNNAFAFIFFSSPSTEITNVFYPSLGLANSTTDILPTLISNNAPTLLKSALFKLEQELLSILLTDLVIT